MANPHSVASRFVLAGLLAQAAEVDREAMADLEHERWTRWMQHLFSKGTFNPDGTWTMPLDCVERWQRQMATPYPQLSESEKDSDRREVDQMLALIRGGNRASG